MDDSPNNDARLHNGAQGGEKPAPDQYQPPIPEFQDIWNALPPDEKLSEIFAHFTDPQRWIESECLEVFAQFYHAKPMWGLIKAKAKEVGASPYDLEEAVKQLVRQQARLKVLEALQQDEPSVSPEDLTEHFTEYEWLQDETLEFLARYYDDAPKWLRIKVSAKKAGINPFDLDKAVKHLWVRNTTLRS